LNIDDSIKIRPASIEDAAAIHSMLIELAEMMNTRARLVSTTQDIVEAMSGNDPAIHILIAEQLQKPVGIALFFLTFSTWRGTRGVYIQDIYLAPIVRGTGLGKRMMGAVVNWASARGADHLRLSVDQGNATAQSFYQALGLSFSEDEMIYEIFGVPFEELGVER
jgi:GNAT superfamily N-acetyltransferase